MKKKSIRFSLNRLVILSIVSLGIVILTVSIPIIYRAIVSETEEGLKNLAHALLEQCNVTGEGDYSIEGDVLCKGGVAFGEDNCIVDNVKEVSGIDATIFWEDTRMLTTIRSEDGERALGTKATEGVAEKVLKGEEYFSSYAWVNDAYYYGYYVPLKNADDTVIGMVFVGKSRERVFDTIFHVVCTVILGVFIVTIVTVAITLRYTKGMVNSLSKTREFLEKVARGDLECQIDSALLERQDEIGEMGKFAQMLQNSIVSLIGTDPLTGLYNRRSCNEVLETAIREYREYGKQFSVVIGDIDNFKNLNDTYGHLTGDQVLIEVSRVFQKHMKGKGSAFRWGGEEFLLVYKEENAVGMLEELLEEIRGTSIHYEEQMIQVTMTFGVSVCQGEDTAEILIKQADDRLYYGKTHGKNQVVFQDKE